MSVKKDCGTYLKEFEELGIARPTALVFCFLLVENAALLSGFLFFSEFALACLRHRLTRAVRGSANNWGSMSESRIGEGVLDVASINSSVAGSKLACARERDVDILA